MDVIILADGTIILTENAAADMDFVRRLERVRDETSTEAVAA